MQVENNLRNCPNLLQYPSAITMAIQLQNYASCASMTWGESEDKLNHDCGFLSHISRGRGYKLGLILDAVETLVLFMESRKYSAHISNNCVSE